MGRRDNDIIGPVENLRRRHTQAAALPPCHRMSGDKLAPFRQKGLDRFRQVTLDTGGIGQKHPRPEISRLLPDKVDNSPRINAADNHIRLPQGLKLVLHHLINHIRVQTGL